MPRKGKKHPSWQQELADSVHQQRAAALAKLRDKRLAFAISVNPTAHQRWLKAQRSRFVTG